MFETWMQTLAVFALGVFAWAAAKRIRLLEMHIDECDRRLQVLQRVVERLDQTMPSSQAKGGWVRGTNPVKETDWLPPSMKHTDIKE